MKRFLLTLAALLCSGALLHASTLGITTKVATTSGTYTGRAKQIILVFSSDFQGTVNGVSYTWAAGGSINLGPFDYDDVETFAYTVTAGTLRIITP